MISVNELAPLDDLYRIYVSGIENWEHGERQGVSPLILLQACVTPTLYNKLRIKIDNESTVKRKRRK